MSNACLAGFEPFRGYEFCTVLLCFLDQIQFTLTGKINGQDQRTGVMFHA
jgi:hypothetical protein